MNIWLKLRKTAAIALCELLAIATIFTGCASTDLAGTEGAGQTAGAVVAGEDSSGALGSKDTADAGKPQDELVNNNSYVSLDAIPAYDGKAYVAVNNNEPFFTDSDMTTTAFENYSDLDSLGRCGVAYANICKEIMPTEKRGKIGMIKPSGWHTVKYDVIKDRYLYNRCHLIGYQLAGENANPKNLITGTRYLNVEGMLPFENLVADYVNNTGNHVLYRVTPMFSGSNLVANGVLIEAKSVEDNGGGILFNVYCYNVQPGVGINYENGDSWLDGTAPQEQSVQTGAAQNGGSQSSDGSQAGASAGDTGSSGSITGSAASGSDTSPAENSVSDSSNSKTMVHITATGKKYHRAGCRTLKKSDTEVTLDEAKSMGLSPCGICNPPQ
ncbi:DNA/RNA non-specific endonuclease [Agathobacter rectalis]|jgi:DNA-entry nuclease|uniref:DNA-entry nuclease n=1 Tax=Agathobacter rectalis TaxID=39491 RepID=A0A412Q1A0_9FIRM|nr:DNA/RNA non-specific endonuclease [Agathobacter rectalis]RGT74341.1 DNA-entry nuclease [Agathobacter rectalis]RGT79399.1 DNA-entry nuclease [Agathobacter rectalis]RGZ91964.1 DNA-entry nuclease [Agathobacter rectalis]